VTPQLQAKVVGWRAALRGRGRLSLELKNTADEVVADWADVQIDSTAVTLIEREIPEGLGAVKLLTVVADSPSDLWIDRLSLVVEVPMLESLEYAFTLSLAQLLRAYDPGTGHVRDHAQFPIGDFDSVPASGFVALGAACATNRGVLDRQTGVAIAGRAISAIVESPREPSTGWLPHWLLGNEPHPDSEWSTINTALAVLAALQAAHILDLPGEIDQLRGLVANLDFEAVTTADGLISHGLDGDGRVLEGAWDAWGGESSIVELLRYYQNPELPRLQSRRQPPAYCGRGFIVELGALFVPQLGAPGYGSDGFGVDWYAERQAHLTEQLGIAGGAVIFGQSPVEVIAAGGATGYVEGGVGAVPYCSPVTSLPGFDGPWRAPHYMGMAASLDPGRAQQGVDEMVRLGVFPPLVGPPEALLMEPNGQVARWHSVQVALNAFFNTLGYYHALVAERGDVDAVYGTAETDARLHSAVQALVATGRGP
jgi:hypothetical protein